MNKKKTNKTEQNLASDVSADDLAECQDMPDDETEEWDEARSRASDVQEGEGEESDIEDGNDDEADEDQGSDAKDGYISPNELLIQAQAKASEAKEKAEEYRNEYLRAVADMRNLRQRNEREMVQARQFAIEAFAKDLLQVSDNMERALAAIPDSTDPVSIAVTDGVRMVATVLSNTLKKHGVTRIEALQTPFDPNLHQAVMQVEDPSVPENLVVQEMQSGYLLNNRLLRPSMVGISKGGGLGEKSSA